MNARISLVLRVGVSVAFLALLFWVGRKDFPAIARVLRNANISFFILAALLNIINVAILASRLKKILAVQGLNLNFKEAIYLNFIGLFFNNFLPTSVGGDLVKAYYATKKTSKKLESFSSVFFDRFFGFLSIGLLALLGIIFLNRGIKDKSLLWGSVIFLIVVFSTFIIFLNKTLAKVLFSRLLGLSIFREGSKLRRLYNAINAYKAHKVIIAQLIGISLVAQLVFVVAVYVLIKGLSQNISFLYLLLIIPLVSVASMVPSINGLGVREGAYIYFLSEFINKESAFAVSILILAIIFITSFVGGILYLFSEKVYKSALS
ncbi:MAG: hypothetical protein AMJ78_05735 [Omnitrophica WOR_2 bacterium SM23_29]|nr:MAG: hypothetical protein AMJ78_05735 [Omnitrophica WOR_2 bacterium SM23_29]